MPSTKQFLLSLILMLFSLPVLASSPAAPSGTTSTTTNFASVTVPVGIPAGPASVSDTITVAGMGTYLLDLDMTTFITHTFAADLDITLTSPSGTVVTITTDNGAGNDDVFNGTVWDDSAGTPATDHIYVNGALASPLVPEEAFGAFIGEDPNGVWTLTINDDLAGDAGTLNNWSLDITTLNLAPVLTNSVTASTTVPVGIPAGPAGVSDTITVTGAGTYLFDLDMTTFITHSFAADLDITLTSPSGTVVTITTDNGAGNDDVFNGTVWDDSAGTPATDHIYVNGVLASPLVPEEAFGAFIGEDPNGVWTLTINDDLAGDAGTLNNWSLDLDTTNIPIYVSIPAPGNILMNTTINTPVNQTIAVSEAGNADLNVTAITLTGNPEITLGSNPAPFTITDGSGATQNIPLTCNSSVDGTFTATLQATHNGAGSPATYTVNCNVGGAASQSPTVQVFDPSISKLGFLRPGQTGVNGEVLEWVVTVSNPGTVAGQNVTVTDTLISALQIDEVVAPNATVNVSGQTVNVTYATLGAGQSVQFSIFTTVLDGVTLTNTACVMADNQAAQECTSALPIAQLPSTGETPLWRNWFFTGAGIMLALMALIIRRQF